LQAHLLNGFLRGEAYLLLLNDDGHVLRQSAGALGRAAPVRCLLRERHRQTERGGKQDGNESSGVLHNCFSFWFLFVISRRVPATGVVPGFNLYWQRPEKHVAAFCRNFSEAGSRQ